MRILLACALLLIGAPAVADDLQRARELYENGARLYEEGLYEDAIAAFQAAYDLSQLPELYYNIANAYERLGKWQQALDALNKYRAFAPAEERETLDRRMRNIERRLSEMPPPTPPPVVIAPPPVVPPPAPATPKVNRRFGPTKIALCASGAALMVGGGATAAWTFADSRVWLDAGDREAWNRWRPVNNAGVVGAGVGAALVIAGLAVPGTPVEIGPASIRFHGRL